MNWLSALPFIGGGLAAAGLAGLSFLGNSRAAQEFSQVSNPVLPVEETPEAPPLAPVDDYGGAKDSLLPALTSVSNRENRWGNLFKVLGKVKIYPALAVEPAATAVGIVQTISGIFECGPGELAFSDPKIAGRPISEFPTLTLEYQYGKDGDAPITVYTQATSTVNPNETLIIEAAPKVVTKTAGRTATRIGVNVTFPRGLYKRNATTGAIEPYTVRIWVGVYNSTTNAAYVGEYVDITAAQTVPYFWYKEYTVPEALHKVSMLRYTPNQSTSPDIVDECIWTDLIAYGSGPLFYDFKNSEGQTVKFARIGYRAQATENLSGSLGEFSIIASSKFPVWDGTSWSAPVETANPAWLICGLLRSPFCYRPATDAEIDLPRFKEFADFCDEKGFKYNFAVPGERSLYETCQAVARAGRAFFYVRDGKYSVLIEKPVETIAAHFTMRNIIANSFSAKYSYVEPPDYVNCDFINKEKDYQQDLYPVYDDGKVKNVDFKSDQMSFEGVDDPNQIYKLIRYYLAQNRLVTGFYQFSTDVEGLLCEFGDRIKVTHERLGWGLGQGRITAVATGGGGVITGITLDTEQVMDLSTRFQVTIRLKTGGLVTREVVAIAGATKTLTFVSSIPNTGTLPAPGDMVSFGVFGNDTRDLRILSVQTQPDLSHTIYAVDYIPQVYEADAGAIPPFVSVIDRPRRVDRTVPVPKILSAQSDESVLDLDIDGSLRVRILLTIGASPVTIQSYEYKHRLTGSEQWSPIRQVDASGGSISIYEVEEGKEYDIAVRARNGNFFSDSWAYENQHLVIGKTTKPPSVMLVYRKPSSNVMGWVDIVRPRDFSHYEIRMALGDNENYDQATVIGRTTDTQIDLGAFAKGLKTFSVKAVDTSGNQSEEPAILKTDFGDISEQNVEYVEAHHPLFPGTKTNCSVVSDKLVADGVGDDVYSDDDEAFMYSGNDDDDFYRGTYSEAIYEDVFVIPTGFTPPFRWYIRSNIVASGYRIEYKPPVESYFYSDGPLGPDELVYSNDDNDDVYDDEFGDWLPFPTNGVELDGAYSIPYRIVLFAGVVQGQIIELQNVIDLPDKVVYYNDVAISASGTRLPTPADFSRTDYVSVTLQSATGKIAFVTEKNSPLGPLVIVQDRATGAGVTGTVDAEVRGIA